MESDVPIFAAPPPGVTAPAGTTILVKVSPAPLIRMAFTDSNNSYHENKYMPIHGRGLIDLMRHTNGTKPKEIFGMRV